MAFNGSGTFVRVHSWAADKAAAVKITASRMDSEDDGFATGLSTCITKDGQTTITANLPMNSKKLTGLAAGTSSGDSVRYEQVAHLAVANEFTATQTITSTDASASAAPLFILDRNSASPADDDILGTIQYKGRDDGGGTDTYASTAAHITDASAGTEDGQWRVNTMVAGTLSDRLHVAQGAWMGSATGSDQGVGSLNASNVYDDGVLLCAPIEKAARGSYNKAEWSELAPHGGIDAHEANVARGFNPESADSYAAEVLAHEGIPGYWNRAEWEARQAETKKDHKGRDILSRVSLAERHERTLLALDYLALAVVDLTNRLKAAGL